jgi:hypothetical protein
LLLGALLLGALLLGELSLLFLLLLLLLLLLDVHVLVAQLLEGLGVVLRQRRERDVSQPIVMVRFPSGVSRARRLLLGALLLGADPH